MTTIKLSETKEVKVRIFVNIINHLGVMVEQEIDGEISKFEHDTIKSDIKWLNVKKGLVKSDQRTKMLHWEVI